MLRILIVSIFTLSSLALAENAKNSEVFLYRYKDAEGRASVSNVVPPEYYQYGYEALDKYGNVIKVVPPTLSEEEKAKLAQEQEKQQAEALQAEKDKQLLKTYSGPEDAIGARDRKLEQLDVIIEITKAKINRLRFDYDREVASAAKAEAAGETVPEDILANLESIETQIATLEAFIVTKEEEKSSITREYEEIIERLSKILEQ